MWFMIKVGRALIDVTLKNIEKYLGVLICQTFIMEYKNMLSVKIPKQLKDICNINPKVIQI